VLIIFSSEVAFEDGLEFGDGAREHTGRNFFGADSKRSSTR